MENKHEIKQGSVYWLSMTRCGYNDKMRPYMVVSNNRHNAGAADVNVVPLTTSDKRLDLPCNVPVGCLVQVGKPCVARCSEITTVRRDRLTSENWCGQADESIIRSVAEAVAPPVRTRCPDAGVRPLPRSREALSLVSSNRPDLRGIRSFF